MARLIRQHGLESQRDAVPALRLGIEDYLRKFMSLRNFQSAAALQYRRAVLAHLKRHSQISALFQSLKPRNRQVGCVSRSPALCR
jgi:FixJ family two-component response regulator